ncbi:MAG TPA: hypothetical protein VLT17_07735 [Gemmatimonadales bacterium]|jgi:hypothetical protein|nr:hypothetical protein [Gemmatimonadales bacterium]
MATHRRNPEAEPPPDYARMNRQAWDRLANRWTAASALAGGV